MKFGFNLPARGPMAQGPAIKAIAERAEALGYAYLAVTDHVVVPRNIDLKYPYSHDGAFAGSQTGEYVEPLTTMSYLAACTSTEAEPPPPHPVAAWYRKSGPTIESSFSSSTLSMSKLTTPSI